MGFAARNLFDWFCCSEALRISFPFPLRSLALQFQAMALRKVQLQRGHQPRRPLRTSCLPVLCLMSSWIGHGQWHPFVQFSTGSTRLAFPGSSTFPGARRPQSAERSRSGSRLLWLPCLALLGRVTHRRGVPCFDRKPFGGRAAPRNRQEGRKNKGEGEGDNPKILTSRMKPFRGRKMQGGGKGKGKGGNPAVLTSKIKGAETAAEVLRLLDGAVDGPIFNDFHASAACTSLADFHEDSKLQAADAKSPVIQRLASRIRILIKAKEVDRRGLANVLNAFAKLFVAVPSVLVTIPALVSGVTAKAKGMEAQSLSNSLWAAAQLQDACPEVLEMVPALVTQIPSKAGEMIPQALSNILLAAAKLQDVALVVLEALPAIAAEISGKAGGMNPQDLSNNLWATAKLQDAIPDILDIVPALVKEIPVNVGNMSPQGLSNCLWATAKLQDAAPEVLSVVSALVEEIPGKVDDMNPQDLSNCLWATAKLQDAAPEVLRIVSALVTEIPVKVGNMIPQELSNCLWATAKLQDAAPEVLQVVPALVEEIPAKAAEMNPQALSNCLFAAMRLADAVPEVIEVAPALVKEVPGKIGSMTPQGLANSLEALVALEEHLHIAGLPGIVAAGSNRLKGILSEVCGKDFSFAVPVVLRACAQTGAYDGELLGAVAKRFSSQKPITSLPDRGVRDLALAYRALDQEGAYSDLLNRLESEISKRGLREEEVLATRG